MTEAISVCIPGSTGRNIGANSDGAVLGYLGQNGVEICFRQLALNRYIDGYCVRYNLNYVDQSLRFRSTNNDRYIILFDKVGLVAGAAVYFGAVETFNRVTLYNNVSSGSGDWEISWQYWNGTAWTNLTVTDPTNGFRFRGLGFYHITFTIPGSWATNNVDGRTAYWVRAIITSVSIAASSPTIIRGYMGNNSGDDPAIIDVTTAANSATTGDVAIFSGSAIAGECIYFGSLFRFFKLLSVHSRARTGTATIVWEYPVLVDGVIEWRQISNLEDDTSGWSASAGSRYIHFPIPADWSAVGILNGEVLATTYYFIRARISSLSSYTQQPLGSYFETRDITGNGPGLQIHSRININRIAINIKTIDAGYVNPSKYILLNKTAATYRIFTIDNANSVFETVSVDPITFNPGDTLVIYQLTGNNRYKSVNFILQEIA